MSSKNVLLPIVFPSFLLFGTLLLLFFLNLSQPCYAKVEQILWNKDSIEALARDSAKKSNPAYKRILSYANKYCDQPSVSVINKPFLPEGCSKNDYVSLSTYAWPDKTKTGGLPYVLRDGYNNPEAENFNNKDISVFVDRMQMLTLAWKLTGEEKYAKKAHEQVRVWFIDAETRMNPNLRYGQIVPGANGNRGNSYGVLDGYSFVRVLDPLLLLEDYGGFTKDEQKAVKQWFEDFLTWLTTSTLGLKEATANNNHGTSYDGQILAFSIYTGNKRMARSIIKDFPVTRINFQIEPDGTQPREQNRPRSFTYSVMNLDRMMDFLLMAKFYGRPINAKKLERYYKAWEYLMPFFGDGQKDWPFQQVVSAEYAQWQAVRDTYIISTYLKPNRVMFNNVERPTDDRTRRSIYSVIY